MINDERINITETQADDLKINRTGKNMKILLEAYACAPNKGSEQGSGWNWAFNLAKAGQEIWCLTSMEGHQAIMQELKSNDISNLHFVFVELPGWADCFYSFPLIGVYFHYLFWLIKSYQVARQLDGEEDFDVIHHVSMGSLQQGTMLWKLKKPLIFGPVGGGQFPPESFKKYYTQGWKTEQTRRFISNLLVKLSPIYRSTMKKSELVLVTNQETYDLAKTSGAKQVNLFLDTGFPDSFFQEQIPARNKSEKLKILWVGRLFPRKGLPLVLEALALTGDKFPYHLTVFGDGPMAGKISKLVTHYGIKDKVSLMGHVPYQKVLASYQDSDVFMFCSLRDSFGSQLLEAMANGLPVICLNHHGARDFVPDNAGIKVPVTTPEETARSIAAAVEHMHQHTEALIDYGKNGFNFAKTQSWTRKAKQMLLHYDQICRKQNKEKYRV